LNQNNYQGTSFLASPQKDTQISISSHTPYFSEDTQGFKRIIFRVVLGSGNTILLN